MRLYILGLGHKACYDWIHILDSYIKFVKRNHIVLELGASNKARTLDLSKHCKKVIGIEYSPERTPKSFKNIKYITGNWQKLTEFIPKESIDIAISSHVIEHVSDDLKAVNELYAVLKPGGIAIMNTPNRKRLTRAIIELFTGERKFPHWEHVREYTKNDLRNLLLKSAFKNNFKIIPVVFGVHGWSIRIYFKKPPKIFRKWANFWEIHLVKR